MAGIGALAGGMQQNTVAAKEKQRAEEIENKQSAQHLNKATDTEQTSGISDSVAVNVRDKLIFETSVPDELPPDVAQAQTARPAFNPDAPKTEVATDEKLDMELYTREIKPPEHSAVSSDTSFELSVTKTKDGVRVDAAYSQSTELTLKGIDAVTTEDIPAEDILSSTGVISGTVYVGDSGRSYILSDNNVYVLPEGINLENGSEVKFAVMKVKKGATSLLESAAHPLPADKIDTPESFAASVKEQIADNRQSVFKSFLEKVRIAFKESFDQRMEKLAERKEELSEPEKSGKAE